MATLSYYLSSASCLQWVGNLLLRGFKTATEIIFIKLIMGSVLRFSAML